MIRAALLVVSVALAAAACSNHDARPVQVAVVPGELYLDSLPVVTVGGVNGAEGFGEVVGVDRLSDGGFVVGDRAERRLRLYDPAGMLVRTVGDEGRNSKKFVQLDWAGVLPGDTLIAFDWSDWKFSLFTRDGAFVRSFRLERSDIVRWPQPLAVLGDGSVLLDGSARPAPPTRRVAAGVYVESTVVARVRTADGVVDSIASYPSRRVYRGDGGRFQCPHISRATTRWSSTTGSACGFVHSPTGRRPDTGSSSTHPAWSQTGRRCRHASTS